MSFSGEKNYRDRVFDDKADTDEKLLQVREYCFSLREWRLEDSLDLEALQRRVAELERRLDPGQPASSRSSA